MARSGLDDRFEQAFLAVPLSGDAGAVLRLRTQLLLSVKETIRKRCWSQAKAANVLGVKQPRISEIMRLRIDKFSLELLVKYLNRLGIRVEFRCRS